VDPYSLVKFLHIASMIAAFISAALLHSALGSLRGAEDAQTARAAAATLARLGPKMPLFVLALLLTGGWLAQQRWNFGLAFVDVAIVGLVLMAAISGAAIKPRTQAVAVRLANVQGPLDAELRAAVRDPALWAWAHVPAPIAAGIVFDMVMKPGWAGSVASVAVAVALGMVPVLAGRSAVAAEATGAADPV
jgi:hypothetical protein